MTLVLWLECLAVGVAGILLPYTRPKPAEKPPPPVVAEIIKVMLSKDFIPPPQSTSAPPDAVVPPPLAPDSTPPAPALTPILAPSPAIAFAKPVEAPPRPTQVVAPQVQRLTYGVGEGLQPDPDYPSEAAMNHQQGTVVVRFTVNTDGRVESAQAATPCPWPLLNQAAVRAVRETWRFEPGSVRVYEVAIQFELTEQ
jgi:periplasmic protein TonB